MADEPDKVGRVTRSKTVRIEGVAAKGAAGDVTPTKEGRLVGVAAKSMAGDIVRPLVAEAAANPAVGTNLVIGVGSAAGSGSAAAEGSTTSEAAGSATATSTALGAGESIVADTGPATRAFDPAVFEPAQETPPPAQPTLTTTPPGVGVARVVERRLAKRAIEFRDTARAFSKTCAEEADKVRARRSNRRGPLGQANAQIAILQQMASGFSDFADALDDAIIAADETGEPEPVLLGKAAEIAAALNDAVLKFLKEHPTLLAKVGVFCCCVGFLHLIGADSWAPVSGLAYILRQSSRPERATTSKPTTSRGKKKTHF